MHMRERSAPVATSARLGISGELANLDANRQREAAVRSQHTILVVENEAHNRHLMEQILNFAGYPCLAVENGRDALSILDRQHIAMVLLDLSMPIMDGYRTAQQMRTRPHLASLPVVAVTAHALREERELALSCGCTEYLTKPFRPRDLLALIERLLPHG